MGTLSGNKPGLAQTTSDGLRWSSRANVSTEPSLSCIRLLGGGPSPDRETFWGGGTVIQNGTLSQFRTMAQCWPKSCELVIIQRAIYRTAIYVYYFKLLATIVVLKNWKAEV